MPHPLRVDDELRAGRESKAGLGAWVANVLAQHHDRVGVVGELHEVANNPALCVGVEAVVIVEVRVVEAVCVGIRLQFDDPAAPDIRTWSLGTCGEGRGLRDLRRDPHAVLVGLRRVGMPEAVALDLTLRAGDGREPGVARGLPIDVFQTQPLGRVHDTAVRVEDDVAGLVEDGHPVVRHCQPPAWVCAHCLPVQGRPSTPKVPGSRVQGPVEPVMSWHPVRQRRRVEGSPCPALVRNVD